MKFHGSWRNVVVIMTIGMLALSTARAITPVWFPDWRGESVAIIASGPSAKSSGIERLAGGCRVIAIKESYELAKFADVVYGCDYPWWEHRRGLPEFAGLKIGFDGRVRQFGVKTIIIKENIVGGRTGYSNDILLDQPGVIGGGQHSGFQALNLAVQFGAARVLLIGYDMLTTKQVHWYGRNHWNRASNPTDAWFERVIPHMNRAVAFIAKIGVEIATASPYGRLDVRRTTVEEWMDEYARGDQEGS